MAVAAALGAPEPPTGPPAPEVPQLGWSGARDLLDTAYARFPDGLPWIYDLVHGSQIGKALETLMLVMHNDLGMPWWSVIACCMLAIRSLALAGQVNTIQNFDRFRRLQPWLSASRTAALSPEGTEAHQSVPLLPDPRTCRARGADPQPQPADNWKGLLDTTAFFRGHRWDHRWLPEVGDAGAWVRGQLSAAQALQPEDLPARRLTKLKRFQRMVRRAHYATPYVALAQSALTLIPVLATGLACRVVLLLDPLRDAHAGGLLWFPDFTVADGSLALPIINTALLYAMYEYLPDPKPVADPRHEPPAAVPARFPARPAGQQTSQGRPRQQPPPPAAATAPAPEAPATKSFRPVRRPKQVGRSQPRQPEKPAAAAASAPEPPAEVEPAPVLTLRERLGKLLDPARIYQLFLDRMQWLTLLMLPISMGFPAGVNWAVFLMCVVSTLARLLRQTAWFQRKLGLGLPEYRFVFVRRR